MSRCRKVRSLLGPYLYEDVAARERVLVEKHLNQCAACRQEFESCRATVASLGPGPSSLERARRRRVEARVAAAIEQSRGASVGAGRALGRVAVVAAAAVLLGCFLLWRQQQALPPLAVAPATDTHRAAATAPAGGSAMPVAGADLNGGSENRIVVFYAARVLTVDDLGELRWTSRKT